jgi:hypothetical protein
MSYLASLAEPAASYRRQCHLGMLVVFEVSLPTKYCSALLFNRRAIMVILAFLTFSSSADASDALSASRPDTGVLIDLNKVVILERNETFDIGVIRP